MQAGVCLRQDTETTLPELTEQHRIRMKEEELSGLESVHMEESETECAAPGLNTLEPECVTAHSGVSDVHHTHTSVIKTEADLGSTHTGDLKTECLDSTELGYGAHLHPDQIKTETDDGGYHEAEHISDLHVSEYVNITSDRLKCELSECSVNDVMDTVVTGAGVDLKDQTEPWQCAGEQNPNCAREDMYTGEMPYQLYSMWEMFLHNVSFKDPPDKSVQLISPTNVLSVGNVLPRSSALITHASSFTPMGKLFKCALCGKCFSQSSGLNEPHDRFSTGEKPVHLYTECEKCFYYQYLV